MTSNAVDRIQSAVPMPERIGQQTAVEQTRAAAEVHAAVVVAQQCPRDARSARDQMLESCKIKALADRAFYSVPNRGNGPTVHLARELARIWGNVQYGVHELSRDDARGMSEIKAYAWDVQTNTRSERTFQVPHARMARKQREALTDLGDIYNNNQNVGARAVRECIYSILPPWLVEEAKDTCHNTLREGGGKPLAQRVSDAIRLFDGLSVTAGQLEERVGRKSAQWTDNDVAQLGILYRSIQRGETRVDDEFETAGVTGDDIAAQAKARTAKRTTARQAPTSESAPVDVSGAEVLDPEDPPAYPASWDEEPTR